MKAPKPSAAQPLPVQPPVQAAPQRPEQMPPVPPQVTYQDGQLSIVAENATLSSILAAVRARTGAQVEIPPETASDRVAAKLGPGKPRDVLASLLEGSRFDYIMLGSAADPSAVSQVILTPRNGGGATPPGATGSQAMTGSGQPQRPIFGGAGRPEMTGEEEEPVEPQPASAAPQPAPVMPPATPPNLPEQQAQPEPTGQANPPQVKTPQQLLQELQRMQQQQQQQQQRRPQQQ